MPFELFAEKQGFEGYFKKANCFAFLKTQALEEKFSLCVARKISEEEESLLQYKGLFFIPTMDVRTFFNRL